MADRKVSALLVICLLLLAGGDLRAQSATPIISGGVGFISTTNAGNTFLQPVIAPVAVVPLGERILIESRADLRGFYARRNGNGPYDGEFFATLEYLQMDVNVNSHLTLVMGRYLTPFGIYNERLTPIWIRNFADAPIIFPIGTRTTGSSDGVMLRGVALERPGWQLNYTGYFSAESGVEQFGAGRAAGGRIGIFIPRARFEIGTSYQRFLQGHNFDTYGAHITWQAPGVPLDVKAEYAHSPGGHGFWLEGAYRFAKPGSPRTWYSGIQPLVRLQQFYRLRPAAGDLLPARDTTRTDFGLNYYLPHDVRVGGSYSRQFTSTGDANVWNVAVTYRFLFPLLPGGTK